MPDQEQLSQIFEELKEVLNRSSEGMIVVKDTDKDYYLDTKLIFKKRPLSFCAVKVMKNYVSYHLLPLYMNPALDSKLSSELKARMQGKCCLNFPTSRPDLYEELAEVTAEGKRMFLNRYEPLDEKK